MCVEPQRVISVVHGQVVWKPHVCVICALFSWAKKICCSAPIILPLKPDRVVRSRGRSGMGSNIAWHRRHNDSVD